MQKKFKTKCIVPNCNSEKSVKFNRFPKNTKQCQLWIQAVKNPFLETLSLQEIQTYRLCQLHFSKDAFFVTAQRPRLKWDAVPSLCLPSEKKKSSKEVKIDLENDEDINKNSTRIIKPNLTEKSFSYDESDNFAENFHPIEQEISCENCLFQEVSVINPVEQFLSNTSKEFQIAEKSKEITIAFKIRANLYKCKQKPKNFEKKKSKKVAKEIKTANCIVPNCKSGRRVTKHIFPKDKYVGKKWVKAIKSPLLKGMSYEEIRKKRLFVCYLHFSDDSWKSTAFLKPRLNPDAVPSLELPEKLIRKEDILPKKPIDLPKNQNEVPNIQIDLYRITTILSYNSMPIICDLSTENIRESSFEMRKNEENLKTKYRSINDIGKLPFGTKYSKEVEI